MTRPVISQKINKSKVALKSISVVSVIKLSLVAATCQDITTHLGIKNYQCDICNKAFIHIGHLLHHKLTHSTIKKYECDLCNRTFTMLIGLSHHKLTQTH